MKTVSTAYGVLEGMPSGIPNVTVFKGVPFAAPPVGENRWRAPQPLAPWKGIRTCYEFSPFSMQGQQRQGDFYQKEFFPIDLPMSEDCLYLNIWTPAETANDRLPVMFWIHGGAYTQGYPHEMEFDGEGFGKRGVILVTATYRLGELGFLAHPALSAESDFSVSGNYALLDHLAALRWVNENITAFGGDPGNVTVFGQSAGAASVSALVASPLSRGLIHKAISMSGGGLAKFPHKTCTLAEAEAKGMEFMAALGVDSIDKMRALPFPTLRAACNAVKDMPLRPVIDGYVLISNPHETISSGKHLNIPLMMGSCGDESHAPDNPPSVARLKETLDNIAGVENGARLIDAYGVNNDDDAARVAASLWTDFQINGYRNWARVQERIGKPAYVYYFDRKAPDEDGSSSMGAFHSSELWYVFSTLHRSWRPYSGADYEASRMMADYFANFARLGDPNDGHHPKWPLFMGDTPSVMRFSMDGTGASDMNDKAIVRALG